MDPSSKLLRNLGLHVIPTKEYLRDAGVMADKIVKLLQQKSRYAIGQICVAGSLGKHTNIIIGSDIDIVVFINDEEPPFQRVISDFEDILSTTDKYGICDVQATKFSLQFKAGRFNFDLLPAVNFVAKLAGNTDSDELIDIQQKLTLDLIKRIPKNIGKMYSSSLAQANVRFLERQDGFVNEMVRIAKYWFKSLYFEEYTSGAKMLIELVAGFSARNEIKKYNERSYLRCFAEIIQKLQKFEELDIVFEEEYIFPEHQLPESTKDGPRVMDPANPYNNLAENWHDQTKDMVKKYAAETYRRLQSESKSSLSPIRLGVVFEPQPSFLPFIGYVFSQVEWIVGTDEIAAEQVGLQIRRENIEGIRIGIEIVKMYLFNAWCNYMAAPCGFGGSLADFLQKSIENYVYNRSMSWSPTNKNHEDFDGTFTFPANSGKSVRVSFKF